MTDGGKPRLIVVAGPNVYDNSIDDARARLLFRASRGRLSKVYGEINPWAREIAQRLLPVRTGAAPLIS